MEKADRPPVCPTREGFPRWGNEVDYNVQVDVASAQCVMEHSRPTLVPLSVTAETSLRRAYLDTLRRSGPLACAIALGWDEGVEIREIPLKLEVREGWLWERVDEGGRPTSVVTTVDGGRFSEFWLAMAAAAKAL